MAIAAALAFSLSACGDPNGLRSAGPTRAAIGPERLWPGLSAASASPPGFGRSATARVPGIELAQNSVRALDPVAVVRAEAAARPNGIAGTGGFSRETVERLGDCEERPAGAAGARPGVHGERRYGDQPGARSRKPSETQPPARSEETTACPVLTAYRHDLTGDGRDELIVGITVPGRKLAVRCYRAENGGLTRIMSTSDRVVGAELAGRDLILRVVSAGIPGYEYRTAWSWDARQEVMLPTRDEIVPGRTRNETRNAAQNETRNAAQNTAGNGPPHMARGAARTGSAPEVSGAGSGRFPQVHEPPHRHRATHPHAPPGVHPLTRLHPLRHASPTADVP
ncbi:hypothetical protein ABZ707_14705 [Streptomyces sp. NPDC006923]|uniref:hypothetical protein n=1 Tax=Streptomyces sp. NPDC006923 TaxID=3155355 RepID=UPI0033FD2B4F